jgi:hypothetical protein
MANINKRKTLRTKAAEVIGLIVSGLIGTMFWSWVWPPFVPIFGCGILFALLAAFGVLPFCNEQDRPRNSLTLPRSPRLALLPA